MRRRPRPPDRPGSDDVAVQVPPRMSPVRAVVMVLLMVASAGCVSDCADDSIAGPFCGLIAEEDVAPIVGRVTEVKDEAYGLFSCDIQGEHGTLVAYGANDSWAAFGQDGNNAMTTM